jgi:hypothetical protein
LNHVSIIIILFKYYIMAAHACASVIFWSFIIFLTMGSMHFYVVQLLAMLIWSTVTVMCIIGSGISLFKILLVTHFDMIFSLDPERLGKKIFIFSLLLGVVPHGVICIFRTIKGIKAVPAVAYFMGEHIVADSPSPMQTYGSTCLIISVVMLLTAVIFIPNYTKRRSQAAILASENHDETMNSISIARVLLGSSGLTLVIIFNIIAQSRGLTTQFPIQTLLSGILICLKLLVFSLHENILKYIVKKLPTSLSGCCPIKKWRNKVSPSV